MSNSSHDRSSESFLGEVISSYTQAQAIEDGVLIDTGTMAREASRLWHVLFIASRVIRTRSGSGDRLLF